MKTLTIDVRRAEPNDATAVSEVHREAWSQAYAGLIPHRQLTEMLERRGEAWWRRATRGPATLLVLDVAGTIAGYATVGLNRARALPQDGEIYEIYLRPEFQGIGMGRKLFGESCRLLRSLGCKGLVVWCLEDSEHAVRFFRRHGGQDMVEGMEGFGEVNLRKLGFVWS
ncbi:GCN5 family acetyltransferase [Rhizobium sp. Root149]|jgi:ribosomal protein S18 acetylase RimI-like enzyme|uniref:Ribosomal protein S18 acetylase RimI-like enzyme n=2 Tax=Rhizobium TaxID=379 RepID=A0A7W6PS69_9HYPH|nr:MULTISPECIES: GNAT family N-acetyltransferase [Rhizobium]KQZ49327.1 GCN5 family acetyltransferase [Rhizobium sp. Root149]MBB4144689.1 ribosomal protein S18 acetylase RimI-like enzyme [Rhizobium rhizoryzae]MCJ8506641.1 GNAT family N-acetyltransferase [Rhizobium lemnae]